MCSLTQKDKYDILKLIDMMLQKVTNTIAKYDLIQKGDKILVAVSGGPDSVFLLHALYELREIYSIDLHVAHLNHSLRDEADEDAKFVEEMAASLGLPCTVRKENVRSFASSEGLSIEDGARRVRYKFLEVERKKFKNDKIATGHTANDEVETLILRTARGTGLKGLRLIPPKISNIIRPLIEIKREDIINFLNERGVPYRIDPSNYDIRYKRNLVRSKIVPILKEINPNFIDSVLKMRESLERDEEFINEQTEKVLNELIKRKQDGKITLDLLKFSNYNNFKRRIIRKAIELVKGDLTKITSEHIEYTLMLAEKGKTGSIIDLPDINVEKGYKELSFVLKSPKIKKVTNGEKELAIPGSTDAFDMRFESYILKDKNELKYRDDITYFDLDDIVPPIIVRNRRVGDTLSPFGGGTKKLKDFFIDNKIPREQRDNIPIVADKNDILWVVGYRRANKAKIKKTTKNILCIKAYKLRGKNA